MRFYLFILVFIASSAFVFAKQNPRSPASAENSSMEKKLATARVLCRHYVDNLTWVSDRCFDKGTDPKYLASVDENTLIKELCLQGSNGYRYKNTRCLEDMVEFVSNDHKLFENNKNWFCTKDDVRVCVNFQEDGIRLHRARYQVGECDSQSGVTVPLRGLDEKSFIAVEGDEKIDFYFKGEQNDKYLSLNLQSNKLSFSLDTFKNKLMKTLNKGVDDALFECAEVN